MRKNTFILHEYGGYFRIIVENLAALPIAAE